MKSNELHAVKGVLNTIEREARSLRDRIEVSKRTREELAGQPLAKSDIANIMCAGVDYWAEQGPVLLQRQAEMIASRPGKSDWKQQTPILPGTPQELAHVLMALLGDDIKAGLRRIINGRPEDPAAGLPLDERAAKLAELDDMIAQDEQALGELKHQVAAAGLRFPGSELFR